MGIAFHHSVSDIPKKEPFRVQQKKSIDFHLNRRTSWCILALRIIYSVSADLPIVLADRNSKLGEEGLDMDEQVNLSPQPISVAAEAVSIPVAADRLYQFAALTAGLFLLFTLL
jgi:hypothetical protein